MISQFFSCLLSPLLATALLAYAGGVSAVEGASGLEVSLRPKAYVSGQRIYLSDIATCTGDVVRCKEATGIDVAQSPPAGRIGFFQRAQFEAVLEKEWPQIAFKMTGADAVRVEAASISIAAESLRSRLEKALQSAVKNHSDIRLRVLRLQPVGQVAVRPSQSQIEFADLPSMSLADRSWVLGALGGNRMIQIKISNPDDAEDVSMFQCNAQISVDVRLPVAKQTLAMGHVISSNDLEQGWILMRRGYRDLAYDDKRLIGRRVKQTVQIGEPISQRFLENPIAINRNQPVKMIIRKGDLELSSRAVSQQAGSVGQTIDVVNASTKKKMRARIVDEQTVEALAF